MLEWFLSSAALAALVIALRYALRGRVSLRLQYALWGLLLLRLLLPVSFGASRLSVQNILPQWEAVPAATPAVTHAPATLPPKPLTPASPAAETPPPEEVEVRMDYSPYSPIGELTEGAGGTGWQNAAAVSPDTARLLRLAWAIGAALVCAWMLYVNLRFALRLRRTRRPLEADCPLPVYVSPAAETPCLFGLLRPAVYLPPRAAADPALVHILAHEYTHFRHGDQLWSLLRGFALVLHWFDPLVWWAAALSRRDGELACDEGTLKRLGEGERASYGQTLIRMTAARRPDLFRAATTMTGGKNSIKERIKLIAKRPKTALLALILLLIFAALGAACTFTGAKTGEQVTEEWFIDTAWPLAVKYAKGSGMTIEKENAEVLTYSADTEAEAAFPEVEGDRYVVVYFKRRANGSWHTLDYNPVDQRDPGRWGRQVGLAAGVRGSNPQEVLDIALSYAQEQLDLVQSELGLTVTAARLTGLTPMDAGTAGLTEGRELYLLEYRFRLAEPEQAKRMAWARLEGDELTEQGYRGQPYLLLQWELGDIGTTWSLLCATDTRELEEVYGTPYMLEKYGDQYTAASVGLYKAYLDSLDPLSRLTGLRQEDVAAVRCRFYASTAAGQSFTLTREQAPELVEGFVDMFSRSPEAYRMRGQRYEDYPPSFSVTYLDGSGNELVTVYEHDSNTVSFGEILYDTDFIVTVSFNEAYAAAKKLGTVKHPQPYVVASSGGVSVGTIYHMRWAETWFGEGWLAADGVPVGETLEQNRGLFDLYTLTRNGPVTLTFSDEAGHGNSPRLRVYDESYELVNMYWEEPEEVLNALEPGTWWCSVSVTVDGKYIPEAERCEKTGYECLFRLVVEEGEGGLAEELSDLAFLEELSGYTLADWDRAVQSEAFQELSDRLLRAATGEEQDRRDSFVMSAALRSDGAYAELLAEVLRIQREADPQAWEEALSARSPEEADRLRQLAESAGQAQP